jgi:hypothetical protein
MDATGIERRLRRIDAAMARTARRAASLGSVIDHHADRVSGAVVDAEASREQFIMSARIAFRDPYRALKSWERHEWRIANLTLKTRDETEVARGAHAAVDNSKGRFGLELRGRRRFGREDSERIAAREALSEMADARSNWLLALRRGRTFSQARDRVGRDLRQAQNRLRSIRLRRAELLEQLREQTKSWSAREEKPPEAREETQQRAYAGAHEFVDRTLKLDNATRRRKRLDRRAGRYVTAIHSLRSIDGDVKSPQAQSLERRVAAYRVRRSELNAVIARAKTRLPENLEVTEDLRADLKEMHRAYRAFAGKQERDARRYPPHLSPRERDQIDSVEQRTARLEKAVVRYRERVAILSDPEFNIPEKGDRDSGYKIRDPKKRQAALSAARRRLGLAELRHRDLRERQAAQTLSLWPSRKRDTRSQKEVEADRAARAEQERRRLERLYRRERRLDRELER